MSFSTILFYRLQRKSRCEKKRGEENIKAIVSSIKSILENLLRSILEKAKVAFVFLKKKAIPITHFLYSSRKTVLLITAVFLLTLVFSFLIAPLFISDDYEANEDYDRTVPTSGIVKVQGLEIYGGDVKYNPATKEVYVDWGELTLGAHKNVSFYVKSNSTVAVSLALNVTDWAPPGIDEYLTISWNYNGTLLSPGEEVFVTVTLEVASSGAFIDFLVENVVTAFGFDLTVYASGV